MWGGREERRRDLMKGEEGKLVDIENREERIEIRASVEKVLPCLDDCVERNC